MINLIRQLLSQILDNIDSDNSNITENEQLELITLLQKISEQGLSRVEAANYIGKSTTTLDNYAKKGLIPKGEKRPGVNGLFWYKKDLDKFLKNE